MTAETIDTLRGLRALAVTLLTRIDEALADEDADAALRTRKTPAAIVRLLLNRKRAMSVQEIGEELRDAGREVTDAALYQACLRLSRSGALRRVEHGVYAASGAPEA